MDVAFGEEVYELISYDRHGAVVHEWEIVGREALDDFLRMQATDENGGARVAHRLKPPAAKASGLN